MARRGNRNNGVLLSLDDISNNDPIPPEVDVTGYPIPRMDATFVNGQKLWAQQMNQVANTLNRLVQSTLYLNSSCEFSYLMKNARNFIPTHTEGDILYFKHEYPNDSTYQYELYRFLDDGYTENSYEEIPIGDMHSISSVYATPTVCAPNDEVTLTMVPSTKRNVSVTSLPASQWFKNASGNYYTEVHPTVTTTYTIYSNMNGFVDNNSVKVTVGNY